MKITFILKSLVPSCQKILFIISQILLFRITLLNFSLLVILGAFLTVNVVLRI